MYFGVSKVGVSGDHVTVASWGRVWCGRLVVVLVAGLALFVSAARATATADIKDPYALVDALTSEVLTVVRNESELLAANPQQYYAHINTLLEPVVAFDYIARGVMGGYARQATPAQRKRFGEVFQNSLINTYAKGMILYANNDVVVEKPGEPLGGKRKVSVIQRVKHDSGEHVLSYTMGLSKADNRWKLLNVVINGVNLGNTFRSQFAQAMEKSGNLDQVIDSWGAGN